MTDEQQEELFNFLTQPERRQKNTLKALEEMAELSEVLLKSLTKNEKNQPSLEKITEEVGDVFFRLAVLVKQLGIEEESYARIVEKEATVYQWYQEQINESK